MNRTKNNLSLKFLLPIFSIIGIGMYILLSGILKRENSTSINGIRNQIVDSVLVAEKNNYLSTRGIGEAGETPDQYILKNWIAKNATEDELKKLTEYPNPVVRAIAVEGLIKNNSFYQNKNIILSAIKDTTSQIPYISGCIMGLSKNMSEYIAEDILKLHQSYPNPPALPNGSYPFNYGINVSDKNEMQKIYMQVNGMIRNANNVYNL